MASSNLDINIKKDFVSIVVALANDVDKVEQLYENLQKSFEKSEIIFVDNGSQDGTWRKLNEISKDSHHVKLVRLRSQFSESIVLDAGLQAASGDKILFFTTRVCINTTQLPVFIDRLNDNADIVVGVRSPRRDSWLNRFVSRLFNKITKQITKVDLQDVNSGVFAAKRVVFESVPFYGSLNTFLPVIAHRQGFRLVEEKIEQLPGKFDQSWYPKNYIRRLLDLISVTFLSNYSKRPLHFLGFLGAVFTIIGALISFYLFVYRIFGFGPIAGRPMLLLGTMLLIIGIQMISIGLLAEMIIYTHASEIKEYNIEEIIDTTE